MDESMIRTLSERVDRLERQNRRLRRVGLASALAVAAVAVSVGAKVLDGDIFLRDPNNNNLRIHIGTNPNTGSSGVEIFDRLGRRRILLGTQAANDVPALIYYDENGNAKKEDRDL